MSKNEIITKKECIPKLPFYCYNPCPKRQKRPTSSLGNSSWFLVLGNWPTSPSLQVNRVSLSNHSRATNGASLYFTQMFPTLHTYLSLNLLFIPLALFLASASRMVLLLHFPATSCTWPSSFCQGLSSLPQY